MTPWSFALVAIGSGTGAASRYAIGNLIGRVNTSQFPWGTWLVNVIGTLLLGLFTQWFTILHHDVGWWLILGEGFCGGFTTFSTMSLEAIALFRASRMLCAVYLGSSLALGLFLAWLATWWF